MLFDENQGDQMKMAKKFPKMPKWLKMPISGHPESTSLLQVQYELLPIYLDLLTDDPYTQNTALISQTMQSEEDRVSSRPSWLLLNGTPQAFLALSTFQGVIPDILVFKN